MTWLGVGVATYLAAILVARVVFRRRPDLRRRFGASLGRSERDGFPVSQAAAIRLQLGAFDHVDGKGLDS